MAVDFSWTPTWVTPREEVWAVLITPTESFKKDRQLLDTNSIQAYDLEFDGVSDSDRNSIKGHFSGVTGPYDSFVWTTVPSYLNAGTTMTVYYIQNTYKERVEPTYWKISLSFEKDV